MKSLNDVISEINKVWSCGSFQVMDSEMVNGCGFSDIKEGDIGIYYDYMDDELSGEDADKLCRWLYDDKNGGWWSIRRWMKSNGYVEVEDNDGSGGGLYYGRTLYRKV